MISIIHCGEDSLAAHVASQLVDRFVAEKAVPWLREQWAPETKAYARTYLDLDGKPGWFSWVSVKDRIKVHPRGLKGYTAVAYKVARAAAAHGPDGDRVLLWSFDTDDKPEKRCREGFERAKETAGATLPVIVAEATPEFDAWIVSGYVPAGKSQEKVHEQVCKDMEFDPVKEPERLTSTPGHPREAKRVCQQLLGLDGQASTKHPEVCRIVSMSPLEQLESNGKNAGVADFFGDLRKVLLPLLGDSSGLQA